MANQISLAAFGVQFMRQVFTPARLTSQFNKQLPPPISGVAPINEAGIGTASYTANVKQAFVAPSTDPSRMLVTLQIDLNITLKLVATLNFRMRAMVPFWIELQTYKPVVVFVDVAPVNVANVSILPLDPVGGGLSQKIWDLVAAQVRPLLAQEVTKALAQTYSSRVIDLRSAGGMAAQSLVEDGNADWSGAAGAADEPPAVSVDTTNAAVSEIAVDAPARTESLDAYRAGGGELGALAAERVNWETFGSLILYHLASPSVVAKELNAAMAKAPVPAKVTSDFWAWSIAVPTLGKASVQYLGQNATEQGLRAVLRLSMSVHVYLLQVWREAWEVDVEVPVKMPVRAYDQPLLIFLATPPVQPAEIALAARTTTNTGVAWGQVETKLREEITKAVNDALLKSGKDRTKVIETLVREALKE